MYLNREEDSSALAIACSENFTTTLNVPIEQPTGQPMGAAAAGWAQMKVKTEPANFKAKVFVTASSSTPSVTSISTAAGASGTAAAATTDNNEVCIDNLMLRFICGGQ